MYNMAMSAHPIKTVDPEQIAHDPDAGGRAGVVGSAHAQHHLARALQIGSVLQTSLELEKVVELFSGEVRRTIPHNSIAFENLERDMVISLGGTGQHSCTYRLVVAAKVLGQVTLMRDTPFDADETFELEYLLCSLVYPLANAIMYKDAVESALKDPLTGIYNRAAMDAAIKREIQLARRYVKPLALIVMDIDNFKSINDTYGHTVGDCVLQQVAASIEGCIRGTDLLSRYGGEEFTVLLNNTEEKGALLLAERIRTGVEIATCAPNGTPINVTISLGIACLQDVDDDKRLFDKADKALYQAKLEGKNCTRLGTA